MPKQKYFKDIEKRSIKPPNNVRGLDDLRSVAALEVGSGGRAFKADGSGLWLGANRFANAPFRVGMDGSMYFESADGKLVIDAVNNRIVIYDANGVARVLIGFQEGGF